MSTEQYVIVALVLCIFVVIAILHCDRRTELKYNFLKCEMTPDLYLAFSYWIIAGDNNTQLCPFVHTVKLRHTKMLHGDGSEILRKILMRKYRTNYNPFRTSSERILFVQNYMTAFKAAYPNQAGRIRIYVRNTPCW